jgi:hypothetical protein
MPFNRKKTVLNDLVRSMTFGAKLRERVVGEPLIWRESHWRIDNGEYRNHTDIFVDDVLWHELDANFPDQLNALWIGEHS